MTGLHGLGPSSAHPRRDASARGGNDERCGRAGFTSGETTAAGSASDELLVAAGAIDIERGEADRREGDRTHRRPDAVQVEGDEGDDDRHRRADAVPNVSRRTGRTTSTSTACNVTSRASTVTPTVQLLEPNASSSAGTPPMNVPISGIAVISATANPRLTGAGRSSSQQATPKISPLTNEWASVNRM